MPLPSPYATQHNRATSESRDMPICAWCGDCSAVVQTTHAGTGYDTIYQIVNMYAYMMRMTGIRYNKPQCTYKV